MTNTFISKYKVIAHIYDTYHIVQISQSIPASLLNVEGIERLVSERKIPRTVATIIYKILLEPEPKVCWTKDNLEEYLKDHKETHNEINR